jgi:hypothetical protein
LKFDKLLLRPVFVVPKIPEKKQQRKKSPKADHDVSQFLSDFYYF